MANTKSAAKRARQTETRKLRNKSVLTGIKREQKKLAAALASGDKAKAQTELSAFSATLDKAAKRGVVHRNLADRRKGRAAKALLGLPPGKGSLRLDLQPCACDSDYHLILTPYGYRDLSILVTSSP